MNRALLAASVFLLGGGLYFYGRRASAAEAPGSSIFGELGELASAPASGFSVAGYVEETAQSVQAFAGGIVNSVIPWQYPAHGEPFRALIEAAERANGIPERLLARQLQQESNFDPYAVNARSGAQGIAQFMPATWAEWGGGADVFDASAAIDAAGRYMRWLYGRTGSWALALAAYNWGVGNVQRRGVAVAPEETRSYVERIMGDLGYG